MKHDNVVLYDTFIWNQNKDVICDDVTFIASCINEAIGDEIKWPTIEEWITLGLCIYFEFQGYSIRLINGTFIEIKKAMKQ